MRRQSIFDFVFQTRDIHVRGSSEWHQATTLLRLGAESPRPHWPKRWPSEAPRCSCWSEKSNSKIECAERLLCPGAWPKRMHSEFPACSRKSVPTKCLTSRVVRGYETSEQRRRSVYRYFRSSTRL